jgi:hypothetical protein
MISHTYIRTRTDRTNKYTTKVIRDKKDVCKVNTQFVRRLVDVLIYRYLSELYRNPKSTPLYKMLRNRDDTHQSNDIFFWWKIDMHMISKEYICLSS